MRTRPTALAALLGLLFTASAVHADLVRYDFTTQPTVLATRGSGSSWPSFLVGGDTERIFEGYFLVDTRLGSADFSSDFVGIGYEGVVGFGLSSPRLNGFAFTTAAGGYPHFSASYNVQWDQLWVQTQLDGPHGSSLALLGFIDVDGTAWNGVYPTGSFPVSPFESNLFYLYTENERGDNSRLVVAPLTALTGTDVSLSVPETGSLLLLGSSVAGLQKWRRRRVS